MMIPAQDILDRFLHHLSWASEIDLATAWATSHKGLRALQQCAPFIEVRAVVGLWHNLTEPLALRMLADVGQLRLADARRRFHPKVILFRTTGRSLAWIGSANFTSGGFGMNEEAVFETSETNSVQDWFDHVWLHCDPLGDTAIDDYSSSRKSSPPQPPPLPPPAVNLAPLEMLKGVQDWKSYVSALQHCDGWWSNHRPWSVLGEQASWRETIEVLHDAVRQQDWGKLDEYDRRRMLGLTKVGGWALLGRMRPPAYNSVFGSNQDAIQKTIREVVSASSDKFPQLAFDAYEALCDVDGVREGIASRLLTLAKPDRFVSLNSGSRDGLARTFDFAPTTLWKPRNYRRLLTAIYNQEWYSGPPPLGSHEQVIHSMRTALLDCFVYDDKTSS